MIKNPGHFHFIGASILSAILLSVSWQPFGLVFTVFFGFVPLLWIEQELRKQQKGYGSVLLYSFLTFFQWNIYTAWWVWNASPEGAIMAHALNSMLMCLPVLLYHRLQFRTDERRAQWAFVLFWLTFEYGHFNWEFALPWITLGNVFSSMPGIVQWYEYTGVLGGSFWVLFVNVRLFRYLTEWNERSVMMRYSKAFNLLFFWFFAPIFLSIYISNKYSMITTPHGKKMNVVVVQPNIDPYKDKFEGMSPAEQTQKMLTLAEKVLDSSVKLVCLPETALVGSLNEDDLEINESIVLIRKFIQAHPNLVVLTGADSYKFYLDKNNISATARKYNDNLYYDAYNTALLIDESPNIQVYHKSRLVPGVESVPYASTFTFIKNLSIDMGGTSGGLGIDPESKAFTIDNSTKIAPVICYESVFGEYVDSYIQKGANLICVITNDGWWGNTPGYKQHFDYSRLRAIETRRYVARAANTGISGFIDDQGNVMSRSEWWKDDAMKGTVILNNGETFYVKHGDYLGKVAFFLAIFYLVTNRVKKTTISAVEDEEQE